jgi:hypothetical protein
VHAPVDRRLPLIDDSPGDRRDAPDSDHAPVVASFDL